MPEPRIDERVIRIFILLVFINVAGTIAYHLVEGWSLFDSLYMTVMTITTTGYGEIFGLSTNGRILSMVLMFVGVAIFFYSINLLIPILVERGQKRWIKMLKEIDNHYIVCGFGIMGREITEELPKDKVVIVDSTVEKVNLAREKDFLAVRGDATEEEALMQANIKKAKALISCLPSDSANAFAVMVAKDLNPEIFTIAILRTPAGSKKINRAGVDMLLSPYSDAARKILMTLKSPAMVELVDVISRKGRGLLLQKVAVKSDKISGKTIEELNLRKKTGCTVIAIERDDTAILPQSTDTLEVGDVLYTMGNPDQVKKLLEIVS